MSVGVVFGKFGIRDWDVRFVGQSGIRLVGFSCFHAELGVSIRISRCSGLDFAVSIRNSGNTGRFSMSAYMPGFASWRALSLSPLFSAPMEVILSGSSSHSTISMIIH